MKYMKAMTSKIVIAAVLAVAAMAARGAMYNFNSTGSSSILDYPDSGRAFQFTYDHAGLNQVTDVSVSFTTSGGWNGDLYAYLSHGSGQAVLLNRVGTVNTGDDGYGDGGFNIVLKSSGATYGDIHKYQDETGYATKISNGSSWEADGRINYTDTARDNTLDVFTGGGVNPNGTWTLFFADMSASHAATLDSWSVSINAVPEPVNVALMVFGGIGGIVWGVRRFVVRRKA